MPKMILLVALPFAARLRTSALYRRRYASFRTHAVDVRMSYSPGSALFTQLQLTNHSSANFALTAFYEVRHRPAPNVFAGSSDRGMRQGQKVSQMMGEGTGTVYRIVVRSELSDRYAVAFEEMKMETKDGETILTGEIIDQPHLYGILDRIN